MKSLIPLVLLVVGRATATCLHPLYFDGCVNSKGKCGDFAGFQLECISHLGNPNGQCLCPVDNKECKQAVEQHDISSNGSKLPQFGRNCQKTGCFGHGQLCNANSIWKDCKECQEEVKCVYNRKDDFHQCHTCSSCHEQASSFDCSEVCGEVTPNTTTASPSIKPVPVPTKLKPIPSPSTLTPKEIEDCINVPLPVPRVPVPHTNNATVIIIKPKKTVHINSSGLPIDSIGYFLNNSHYMEQYNMKNASYFIKQFSIKSINYDDELKKIEGITHDVDGNTRDVHGYLIDNKGCLYDQQGTYKGRYISGKFIDEQGKDKEGNYFIDDDSHFIDQFKYITNDSHLIDQFKNFANHSHFIDHFKNGSVIDTSKEYSMTFN